MGDHSPLEKLSVPILTPEPLGLAPLIMDRISDDWDAGKSLYEGKRDMGPTLMPITSSPHRSKIRLLL